MTTPYVDNVAIGSRADWVAIIVPGPESARVESHFAGVGVRHVAKGPTLPPDIVIEGMLEGTGASVLLRNADARSQLLAWELKRDDGATYTLKLDAQVFSNVELLAVQQIGPLEARQLASGTSVSVIPVRLVFRQLAR